MLSEHCKNLGEIYSSMENVGRYAAAIKRINKLDAVEEFVCGSDFIASVDKLLNDLVTNYDEEELRLRKEQEFYKLVMEHEGDVEAAKKQYDVYLDTVKDAPNIGKQMFSWAAYATGVDESVQKFALQKTKCWYLDALNEYDHDIKATAPASFTLEVDLWKESTDGKDREAVKKSLNDKFKAEKSKLLVFIKPNIVLSTIAIALLIIGCVVGIAASVWWGYVAGAGLFVVFFGIVLITTLVRLKGFPARVKRAEDTLNACLDEIDGFRNAFDAAAAVKDEISKKLEYI